MTQPKENLPPETAADFNIDNLRPVLREYLGAPVRNLEVRSTTGGQSNPTYFVTADDWRGVLRKQPGGVLAKSAHAIDREFRVLKALHGSDVPVPEPYTYCDDAEILGTPFYLMEWLEGRVVYQYSMPSIPKEQRIELFDSMAKVMAAIHKVDFRAVGLGDYGREGNYFQRQLRVWSGLWDQYRKGDDDNPALDEIIVWLNERVPESELIALCHGDYRFANTLVHKTEPRILGVIDWELSTLGHPLVDVAFNTMAYDVPPEVNGGIAGLDIAELGVPTREDYLERYYAYAGSTERLSNFHRVFGMFRGSVGSAGVQIRGEKGNSTLPDSARIGRMMALAYAERGLAIARQD
ncbi:MAG: phosphotransferase family protein [Rhodobiaceae bacterium]|nr:phosphotransferase family protein [Rhodobiaceae bacterium]MCC0054521.1 phosphotransferase family protein [Rhodobiaceae bacterium]